jgi:predicted nucleic acid-binding protein
VSTLRYGLRRRELTAERAAEALANYLALPMTRHRHAPLLARVLELRENFTVNEASYVALAERLTAPLVTLDRRLAAAVARHVPAVQLVP